MCEDGERHAGGTVVDHVGLEMNETDERMQLT
jgi:hypothetical protein